MDLDLFKRVVDLAENKVQMISIASRGEPTLIKILLKCWIIVRINFLF